MVSGVERDGSKECGGGVAGSLTVEFYWTLDNPEIKMLPDGAGGFIEHTFPAGKYKNSIDFIIGSNGIWKIENI